MTLEVRRRSLISAKSGHWKWIFSSASNTRWKANWDLHKLHSWRTSPTSKFYLRTKEDFWKWLCCLFTRRWTSSTELTSMWGDYDSTCRTTSSVGKAFTYSPNSKKKQRRRKRKSDFLHLIAIIIILGYRSSGFPCWPGFAFGWWRHLLASVRTYHAILGAGSFCC